MESVIVSIMGSSEPLEISSSNVAVLLLSPKHSTATVNNKPSKYCYRMPIVRVDQGKTNSRNEIIRKTALKLLNITKFSSLIWIQDLNISFPETMQMSQLKMVVLFYKELIELNTLTGISKDVEFKSIQRSLSDEIGDQSIICIKQLKSWFNTIGFDKILSNIHREQEKSREFKNLSASLNSVSQKTAEIKSAEEPRRNSDIPQISNSNKENSQLPLSSNRGGMNVKVVENRLSSIIPEYVTKNELTVVNPFWHMNCDVDKSKIQSQGYTSFYSMKDNITRKNASWNLTYPIHSAATLSHNESSLKQMLADNSSRAQLLLQYDWLGWTPLHYAVWHHSHLNLLTDVLKSREISPNCTTQQCRNTLLHLAVMRQFRDIIQLLLSYPDIDLKRTNAHGDSALELAEINSLSHIFTEYKSHVTKPMKIQISLMNQSTKEVLLIHGHDTTIQDLHIQMIDVLQLPYTCYNVFSIWIATKASLLSLMGVGGVGKAALLPYQSFGAGSEIKLSEIAVQLDENVQSLTLWWRRNIFHPIDIERKLKYAPIIELLYEESRTIFTTQSLYPCDTEDILLLACILLYLQLTTCPNTATATSTLSHKRQRNFSSRSLTRDLSHSQSTGLSTDQKVYLSNSLPKPIISSNPSTGSSTIDLSNPNQHSNTILSTKEIRMKIAQIFIASERNLLMIMPKQKIKCNTQNYDWFNNILESFQYSAFSYKNYSLIDAKYRFLTLCWNLTLYGSCYFEVEIKFKQNMPFVLCVLALNDIGIYVLQNRNKELVFNFRYNFITCEMRNLDSKSNIFIIINRHNQEFIIRSRHCQQIMWLILNLKQIHN